MEVRWDSSTIIHMEAYPTIRGRSSATERGEEWFRPSTCLILDTTDSQAVFLATGPSTRGPALRDSSQATR